MRKWIDENTGRAVRQLTDLPDGCRVGYFRFRRHLAGGLILASGKHPSGNLVAIDPESGDLQLITGDFGYCLSVRESDGRAWFYKEEPDREVWAVDLPDGTPELVGTIAPDAPGSPIEITCDEKTVILADNQVGQGDFPIPSTLDVAGFWLWLYRPRHGTLWSYNLESSSAVKMAELERVCMSHVDTSPTDPGLIKHNGDSVGMFEPRMWLVRIDGSDRRVIRPSVHSREWTHHEFWWPDGQYVGYKYMDRANDVTIHELPWGEYAPVPLHLGIADLSGREVYKSDPLCCYQSHIFASPDGTWVCGEGTDRHSFAYAAPFSMSSTKVDFKPYATIHTPYLPVVAQGVETGFSADNKWLIYNDTIDGKIQVCAVEV